MLLRFALESHFLSPCGPQVKHFLNIDLFAPRCKAPTPAITSNEPLPSNPRLPIDIPLSQAPCHLSSARHCPSRPFPSIATTTCAPKPGVFNFPIELELYVSTMNYWTREPFRPCAAPFPLTPHAPVTMTQVISVHQCESAVCRPPNGARFGRRYWQNRVLVDQQPPPIWLPIMSRYWQNGLPVDQQPGLHGSLKTPRLTIATLPRFARAPHSDHTASP